jgi:hypothetical protein
MAKLHFSDGVEIETGGRYRIVRLKDGLYVTGHGFLCACSTVDEAMNLLAEMKVNEPPDEAR